MGGNGSSSKRKFSKKKSSKISSEVNRRKKSRKTKFKKLRRSASASSSSSEDDYRKARSRKRSDVKGIRKRARRSSSSNESSRDLRRAKKRKGSKRKVDSEVIRKFKKKPRRDASINSVSNDSRSCSTCRGGSVSSEDSEFRRPRGRSRENNRDKSDLTKGRSGTKNNKIGSRSSSCSRCSDSSDYSNKQILACENSSRRLRSVVTIPKQPQDEEREWDRDGHKDEIVYDYDDYPSCRSNDSNDWGGKRDLDHHLHVAYEKKKEENVKGEQSLVSNIRTTKLTESFKDSGGKDDQSNWCSEAVEVNNSCEQKNIEVSATITSSDGGDLESLLRQKALENLRKFQGGHQTNAKTPADQKNMNGSNVKQSCTVKAEFVQNKLLREGGSRVLSAIQAIDQNSRLLMMRDSSHSTRIDQKIQEQKYSGTESGTAERSVVCPPDEVALSGNPQEKEIYSVNAVTNNSESGRSALREYSLGTRSILKQSPMSQASPKSKLVMTDRGVNDSAAETSQIVDQTSNKHDIEVTNADKSAPEHSSCLKPSLEEHNSNEQQEKAKEISQFEQKTMSVMRGGEVVQVSYKVYIPKKASAMARRQLRR